jgi:hypothetical protein
MTRAGKQLQTSDFTSCINPWILFVHPSNHGNMPTMKA